MSYLPDNSSLRRPADVIRPVAVCKSLPAPAPSIRREPAWSAPSLGATVLVLCCAAVALMAWGAASSLPRGGKAEKLLRAEQSPPKLMGGTEASVRPNEPVPALATVRPIEVVALEPPLKIEPAPVPPMATPEPLRFELPPVPLPPVPLTPAPAKIEPPQPAPPPIATVEAVATALPERHGPLVFVDRAQPGETPMIRTWKTLTLYSLLATAPLAAPAPVVAGGQDDAKLQKQFDDLRALLNDAVKTINAASKGVDGLRKDISKVEDDLKAHKLNADVDLTKTNVKLENLDKQLGNLQADVNFIKRELSKQVTSGAPVDRPNLDDLKKQLTSIEQAILKLQPAEATTKRIALSPPAPSGRVILSNLFHEEMLFIINQKAHRVAPGTVLPLESVPAGTLTYEVLSPTFGLVRPRTLANLPANETFTLTAVR